MEIKLFSRCFLQSPRLLGRWSGFARCTRPSDNTSSCCWCRMKVIATDIYHGNGDNCEYAPRHAPSDPIRHSIAHTTREISFASTFVSLEIAVVIYGSALESCLEGISFEYSVLDGFDGRCDWITSMHRYLYWTFLFLSRKQHTVVIQLGSRDQQKADNPRVVVETEEPANIFTNTSSPLYFQL